MSASYIPSQLSELTGTITTSAISDFAEGVDDRVNALLVAGTGITLTYNDASGTMTVASSGGGLTVGAPITGGGNTRLLYQNASGNLAQDAKMSFNGNIFQFVSTPGYEGVLSGLVVHYGTYNNAAYSTMEIDNYSYAAPDTHVLGLLGGAAQSVPLCRLRGVSSTSTKRTLGYLDAKFAVSTDASYAGRVILSAQDFNATAGGREGLRVESSGTAAKLSFFGGTAQVKPTISGSRGANAALASLLTSLANLGLITDSTT